MSDLYVNVNLVYLVPLTEDWQLGRVAWNLEAPRATTLATRELTRGLTRELSKDFHRLDSAKVQSS